MMFDYISIIIGIIKSMIFTLLYPKRINIKKCLKVNSNFHFILRKNTILTINQHCKFRKNINIRNECNGHIIIGEKVFFNDNVSINCQDKIVIGDNVNLGHNVIIIDHDHDYKNNMNEFKSDPVIVGKNVWIGANCIILKGCVVPDNCVIAAGTVLTKKECIKLKSNSMIYTKRIIEFKEVK